MLNYYIIILTFKQQQTKNKIMATGSSSQSQPSYLHCTIEQRPSLQAILSNQLLDQHSAIIEMNRLALSMNVEQGQRFQECLHSLNTLFEKGYSHLFITHTLLMRKMMNHFTKLGKQIKDDTDNSKLQLRMLLILSSIAQLLRNNAKFYYPFTRKFLITMFSIDAQLIEKSAMRKQILAILAVIYENLSRQPKLVIKYSIQSNLKLAVLNNYPLIEEIFTLKAMNKTIQNLVNKGIYISVADFHKYRVMETVSKIIAKNQMDLFCTKMKMTMLNLSMQSLSKSQCKSNFLGKKL